MPNVARAFAEFPLLNVSISKVEFTVFSFLVCNFAVCRMWHGHLPKSVCRMGRMCPFLKLNLLMRRGSIFECRRLPIVAVLFVTVSDCVLCVCGLWLGRLRLWDLCLPNVAVAFAECGRRVCKFVFRMCRHPAQRRCRRGKLRKKEVSSQCLRVFDSMC